MTPFIYFAKSWLRFLLAIFIGGVACAQTVWLPAPGRIDITPDYTFQTFDTYQRGATSAKTANPVSQQTATVNLDIGISTTVAADVTLGYSDTYLLATAVPKSDTGMIDSLVGVRYRFLPTLALRVGAIIQGTYTRNFPFSVGDGASGVETSLLFGKTFGESGAGTYGDFGYRHRNHAAPDGIFGSAGVYKNVRRASLSLGYRHLQSLSGPNIGDPGFIFSQVKVVSNTMEFGVGIRGPHGQYYQFFTAKSVGGRNVGHKTIIGVATTFNFRPAKIHVQ